MHSVSTITEMAYEVIDLLVVSGNIGILKTYH